MYNLCGEYVPTHKPRVFIQYVFLSERACRVSPLHWMAAEVTDRPSGAGADGRCGDLTQSELCTHARRMKGDFSTRPAGAEGFLQPLLEIHVHILYI